MKTDRLPEKIRAALAVLVRAVDNNRSADVRGEVEATILEALAEARKAGAREALRMPRAADTAVRQPAAPEGWDIDIGTRIYVVTAPDAVTAESFSETLYRDELGASNIEHTENEPSVLVWFDSDDRSDHEIHATLAGAVAAFVGGLPT